MFLLWILFVIYDHVCLCYAVLSVPCSLVITCWKRADPLALLCVVFSCVCVFFVTFPYGFLGHVSYLIVSIPVLCLPLYFLFFSSFRLITAIKCLLSNNLWNSDLRQISGYQCQSSAFTCNQRKHSTKSYL